MNLTHFASPLPFLCAHTWVDVHAGVYASVQGIQYFLGFVYIFLLIP